jgi:hypothetical protein
MKRLALTALVMLTALVLLSSGLGAQQATRLFATLSGGIATGVSTPVLCTASGSGCLLDVTIAGGSLPLSGAQLTATSATGTTVDANGYLQTGTYKVTVASTAFVCAAVTCDVTIGTLPAKTWLQNSTVEVVTVFACAATCTSTTLSTILGKGAGGSEYMASADVDAATAIFGDADAEMGTLMTRAAAIQGGTFNASSQAVVLRLTSGTGNIGNGTVTNLSQGSLAIWLTTLRLP